MLNKRENPLNLCVQPGYEKVNSFHMDFEEKVVCILKCAHKQEWFTQVTEKIRGWVHTGSLCKL